MKDTIIRGKAWVITDSNGKLIEDIDTDQIYHNAHLHITDREEMAKYAFGNLEGWEDFPKKANKGDIIFTGRNFGAGSSRQHAVDCFIALGISAIVSESFGAIYKRNAINSGLPIVEFEDIKSAVENGELESGDEVEIDLENGEIKNITNGKTFKAKPFSKVQMDIYQAGSLFEFAKSI